MRRRQRLGDTDPVPDTCTCGAQLLPDSLFCHKCGKPQRDEPLLNEEPAASVAVADTYTPAPPPAPAPVSFRNQAAVRVAFFSASVTTVLSSLPLPSPMALVLFLVWLLGAGVFSVYLYRRRTGESLPVGGGARLGWMTGVFSFAISTLLFTISMLLLSGHTEGLSTLLREQLNQKGLPKEMVEQAIEVLLSPVGFALAVLFSLILRFASFAGLSALGGALGARFLSKR